MRFLLGTNLLAAVYTNLLRWAVLRPILKPITRIVVGLIAIPLFRLFMKHGLRQEKVEEELEHDLEQWFRAAVILLVATANMEHYIFGWVPLDLEGGQAWVGVFFRLLLVIGVIELMPDQALFGVIHGGAFEPPVGKGMFRKLWTGRKKWAEKAACKHLNRSTPVFAMMSAIFGGEAGGLDSAIGWICYLLAIVQYLIIALITSADKAGDLIGSFDRAVAEQREDLVEEFVEEDEVTLEEESSPLLK